MTRLLDDLLDVSRITRGRIVLRNERDRSARHRTIGDRGAAAADGRARHAARPSTSATSALPVDGDAGAAAAGAGQPAEQRHQVLAAGRRRSASSCAASDGEAVIRVTDDGRGIEPELLPRIFDLFVQGDQSIARSEGGLGIGLTLLRSLVELHHGGVEAHSDGAGRGSVFTVRLPLAAADARPTRAARPRRGRRCGASSLVEDQAGRAPDDAAAAGVGRPRGVHRGERARRGGADRAHAPRSGDRGSRSAGDERLRAGAADPPQPEPRTASA